MKRIIAYLVFMMIFTGSPVLRGSQAKAQTGKGAITGGTPMILTGFIQNMDGPNGVGFTQVLSLPTPVNLGSSSCSGIHLIPVQKTGVYMPDATVVGRFYWNGRERIPTLLIKSAKILNDHGQHLIDYWLDPKNEVVGTKLDLKFKEGTPEETQTAILSRLGESQQGRENSITLVLKKNVTMRAALEDLVNRPEISNITFYYPPWGFE